MRQSIYLICIPGYSPNWHPLGIAQIKTQVEHLLDVDAKTGFWSSQFVSYIRHEHPHLADILYDMSETGSNYHEMFFSAKLFLHAEGTDIIRTSLENEFNGRDVFRNRFFKPTKHPLNRSFRYYLKCVIELCNILDEFLGNRIDELLGANHKVIGFSCLSCQLMTSLYVIKELKNRGFKGQIWVGGPAVQEWNTEDLQTLFPDVDKFIVGQGVYEFLRFFGQRIDIHVIEYLRKGESLLGDFSDMPKNLLRDQKFKIPILLHGGCSWARCRFCTAHSPLCEQATPNYLVRWIEKMAKCHKNRSFGFADPNLNCSSHTFDLFLRRMLQLKRKTKKRYILYGMLNTVDLSRQRISDMRAAGFQNVLLGVEHFSDIALSRMDKEATAMDNVQAIKWFCELKFPKIIFNIIIDYPNVTSGEVEEAYHLMQRIQHLILGTNVSLSLVEFDMQRNSRLFADSSKSLKVYSFQSDKMLFPGKIARKLSFFSIKYPRGGLKGRDVWKEIEKVVDEKQRKYSCNHEYAGDKIVVTRCNDNKRCRYVFDGWKSRVYDLISDRYCSIISVLEFAGQPRKEVNDFLLYLVGKGLAIIIDERVMAISVCER
jgi:hypothetical protein